MANLTKESASHLMDLRNETLFVHYLVIFFRELGDRVSRNPWSFIISLTLVTLIASSSIPLTKMTNDATDYTPLGARSRKELKVYYEFFSRKGHPILGLIFITAKGNNGSMLGMGQINESIRVLDIATNNVFLKSSHLNKSMSFLQFCTSFCEMNEPVRGFHSGLLANKNFSEKLSAIDLSFPITTVLGMKFRVDYNFYGVEVEIAKNGKQEVVTLDAVPSHGGKTIFDDENSRVKDNVRKIGLIMLQLRANVPYGVTTADRDRFEMDLVNQFKYNFSSDYVNVLVMTPTYGTSEIVRSGFILVPYIATGFIIMCSFSMITNTLSAFFMSQMHYSKICIAILICVCPIMACGTSLGILFWLGMRFGTTLCITPFLVLAIGADDGFLMVHTWQLHRSKALKSYSSKAYTDMTVDDKVRDCICAVLEEIGPSITITTLTNVIAFAVGAITPTPEVRLFCIGNALAMFADFVYQITLFTSVMVILGRQEIKDEDKVHLKKVKTLEKMDGQTEPLSRRITTLFRRWFVLYCDLLCSKLVSLLIVFALILYWCISFYGIMNMNVELRPENLLSKDSDMVEILRMRENIIIPYYSICFVIVEQPGDINNPNDVRKLNSLVDDFERLPSSSGKYSTNFWLRDFEEFVKNADQVIDEEDEEEISFSNNTTRQISNEIPKFLTWPEFRFWRGFLDFSIRERKNVVLNKFFFTIASRGRELRLWSQRALLLQELRGVADKYPELYVTIYDDDAKYLDLISVLKPQTIQSSLCTIVCMMFICLLFIKKIKGVFIATFSVISTTLGMFGFLSHWGMHLDPLVMSAMIMSIGFSVDIPAHVTYHYFSSKSISVKSKLHDCFSAVAFPILQASISSLLCILSLICIIDHYFASVFVKAMTLIAVLGVTHGLIIIPVLFNIVSFFSIEKKPNSICGESQKISSISFRVNDRL